MRPTCAMPQVSPRGYSTRLSPSKAPQCLTGRSTKLRSNTKSATGRMLRTAAFRNRFEQARKEICMERIPIKIAYLAADDLHLRVDLGACRFEARPGNLEGWVAGTCHDPTGRRAPIIDTGEQLATITEAESSLKRIPAAVGPLP